MKKLAAISLTVLLLQGLPSLAAEAQAPLGNGFLTVDYVTPSAGSHRDVGPSLSSSEIAAVQYRESEAAEGGALSSHCQTRAGVFAVHPPRPADTTCAVNSLPGFMLP